MNRKGQLTIQTVFGVVFTFIAILLAIWVSSTIVTTLPSVNETMPFYAAWQRTLSIGETIIALLPIGLLLGVIFIVLGFFMLGRE